MTLTAKRTAKQQYRSGTGLETIADLAAFIALLLGALVAFVLLMTFTWVGALSSLITIVLSTFSWLLLRILAEHLRLLKKIAGHEYQGTITGVSEYTVFACGNCRMMLHNEHTCETCGAKIEIDSET